MKCRPSPNYLLGIGYLDYGEAQLATNAGLLFHSEVGVFAIRTDCPGCGDEVWISWTPIIASLTRKGMGMGMMPPVVSGGPDDQAIHHQ